MKKIALFAFAVGAMNLASCKKDRTCTCSSKKSTSTVNSGANPVSYADQTSEAYSNTFTITNSKKSVARPNCLSKKVTDTSKSNEGTPDELTTTTSIDETCSLN